MSTAKTFSPAEGGLLEPGQHGRALAGVGGAEVGQPAQLALLLLLGRAGQLEVVGNGIAGGVAEGVDPDDGQAAVVLLGLVEHRLVLDAAPLVAGLHGAEHAAPLAEPLQLGQDGLLDQVGELLDGEAALEGVLVAGQAPLLVDDHLDGQGPADRLGASEW